MAVQLKNPYHHLPLTITPILCQPLLTPAATPPKPEPPDLTFHCMCCTEYFVHPLALYQHMNSKHPNETTPMQDLQHQQGEAGQQGSEDDSTDYSWIFEPVCELEVAAGTTPLPSDEDSDSNTDDEAEEASDVESDNDSDSSSSSNSSSSSSSSTTSSSAGNSNSNTQQSLENGAYVEVQSTHPVRGLLPGTQPNEYQLQTVDPHESTSIILLQSSLSITPVTAPVAAPAPQVQSTQQMQLMPTLSQESSMPTPIRRRRGRRSKANVAIDSQSVAAAVAQLSANGQKCFQCTHCEASFPNAGDLSKHVRSHISNKPFQCSICQKTFTHIGSLNTHIRIHSGEKPYKCELCPKAFTQSSSLMVHMRSHAVRKPHQCLQCDKGFINYSSLLLHQKSHSAPVESFTCPECEREFKAEALLDEHMRMHTQELVYQCAICRQAFRASSELVQHMKCHMGEKPFTCSLCDRSFTQSGSLNIHMRIHTGEKPFQCKLCDKCFTQASSLSVHMKIHAGEKPFPCHICGKAYSQQAYLNKHIQAHAMDATPERNRLMAPALANGPAKETLVCIVCGALHADATALALHVTKEHTALLDHMKQATLPPAPVPAGKCSVVERQAQQQAYVQRVQSMLQQMNQQQQQLPAMDSAGEDEEELDEDELGEEDQHLDEITDRNESQQMANDNGVDGEDDVNADDDDEEEEIEDEDEDEQLVTADTDMYYDVPGDFADMEVGCEEEVCGDFIDNDDYAAEEEVYTEDT